MSYNYNINPVAPFESRITGPNYNTLYTFNTETEQPFQSHDEAEAFCIAEIDKLENPVSYDIWYHIEATGGDGMTPAGIRNDGVDALSVTITARETQYPSSPIRDINDSFRMEIRTQDGFVYDVVLVTFVNGVGTIAYTDDSPKGNSLVVSIQENMLVGIDEDGAIVAPPNSWDGPAYSVYLTGDTQFIVYRVI